MSRDAQCSKGVKLRLNKHFALFLCLAASFACADDPVSVKFNPSTQAIAIDVGGGQVKHCGLARKIEHAAPHFNWNKKVVILTDVDFVRVRDVQVCSGGSVVPSHIPQKVGFLVDVNQEHNVYLALDLVGVTPMAFTATVARLGETRSVLSAPGIYSEKKGDEKMKEEAFSHVMSTPGRISPDGRYVSADGTMDCRAGSYPGVWDLTLKKPVTRDDGCEELFPEK